MINTVITSSVLILIILAIRIVFKGRVNPMVQYGLWSLVALRLAAFSWLSLHPIQSALSVMNVTGSLSKLFHSSAATEQVLTGTAQAGAMENAVFIMANVKTGVMVNGEGISPAASIDWQLMIFGVWAIGVLVIGVWLISVNLHFGKSLARRRTFLMPAEVERNGKTNKSLPVYISDKWECPCLMRYRGETAVYVTPEVVADEAKLRYAVTHELCHYQHYDLTWSVVRSVLLTFYWFNPLVWVAAFMSKRDCEVACDYEVIKKIGEEDRLAYGKSLVDLIACSRPKSHVLHMATTMYGGAKGIKERVAMIAGNKRMKVSTLVAVLMIAALSVGCTFTAASEQMVGLSNNSGAGSSQASLNPESSVIIDPGHGGTDAGMVFTDDGKEIAEKDLNLKLANLLHDMLNDSGATVEMTRQEDQEMSLEERMKMAEASGASLFLSIHFENSPNASNTVIAQYNPALGEKAASSICDGFTGELGLETKITPIDESLKFSRIEIPAIIIDMPFMFDESNKGKLSTEEYTLKTAQTLYEGIIKSLNEKGRSQ